MRALRLGSETAWLEQEIGPNVTRFHVLGGDASARSAAAREGARKDEALARSATAREAARKHEDFLGAGPGSLAPVEGPNVPQRACTITREGGRFRLRDVGSRRRGTLVNDCYVKEAVLVPGDQIRIGAAVFRFRQLPAGAPGEAAAEADVRKRQPCP